MPSYNIAETFLSINGEGTRTGQLAFFIRFAGCNLRCSYCDTAWANTPDAFLKPMTAEELCAAAEESGAENITLTGGEPLLQHDIRALLLQLCSSPKRYVEIETNGSLPLAPYLDISNRPAFTMDYKLPGSGMESGMFLDNLPLLTRRDTIKFVCGSREDFCRAVEVMEQYGLIGRTNVYLSPVFGKIAPAALVDMMKEKHLAGVTLQLQLHKIIWEPERQGV